MEGIIFFFLLLAVTLFQLGDNGLTRLAASLDVFDVASLSGVFMLILSSIGIYNRDAVYQFGVLLQRSAIFLFIIVFLGLVAWAVDDILPWINISSYVSLITLATVLYLFAIMGTRLAFISMPKLDTFKTRVLVVGRGSLGQRIRNFLGNEGSHTLKQVGYIDLDDPAQSLALAGDGATADLCRLAREADAHEIVIASREWRGLPVWKLLDCKMSGTRITDYLSFWEREAGQIDLNEVKPSWLALSDGFRQNGLHLFVKRTLDITVSLAFLLLTLPILVIAAALIKLESKGPVFYLQQRIGRHGRTFNAIKFRSMYVDAEKDGVPQWAAHLDPRVTRLGHVIRRARIDEIPQMFNVLRGDMSFVGPRPERPFFVKELSESIPLYDLRHNVRPGITGWAQINYPYGASVEDARRKLEYDLYYVKNGGLFLDFVIILQTVRVVLSGDGAR